MNSFSFGRPVEIEGQIYYLSSDFNRAKKVLEDTRDILADPNTTDVRKQVAYATGLNAILGEGAFKKIFGNRAFSFVDATGLIIFLTNEITEWAKEFGTV